VAEPKFERVTVPLTGTLTTPVRPSSISLGGSSVTWSVKRVDWNSMRSVDVPDGKAQLGLSGLSRLVCENCVPVSVAEKVAECACGSRLASAAAAPAASTAVVTSTAHSRSLDCTRRAYTRVGLASMGEKWTAGDIGDLSGRVAVVTGSNSGIGAVCAGELAAHGARVVLAVRNTEKGEAAATDMPGETEVRKLDLAELASVRAFAEGFDGDIDLLVNNAGVMALPHQTTADGFEMQLGTNHLGHFALTGLLLPRLLGRPEPRVVTISSGAHRMGRMNFGDLQGERRYRKWNAYGQSKLANLLFMRELQRRADAAGAPLRSVAAHPGWSETGLQQHNGPARFLNRFLAQDAEHGALPMLYAATSPDVRGGGYVGPDGILELHGHPKVVPRSKRAKNAEDAARLWALSEELTGVTYAFNGTAGPAAPRTTAATADPATDPSSPDPA
jgi:NAD(P)-dependent dehydrogenase (short-subunit alcohol dehydrogenase family)